MGGPAGVQNAGENIKCLLVTFLISPVRTRNTVYRALVSFSLPLKKNIEICITSYVYLLKYALLAMSVWKQSNSSLSLWQFNPSQAPHRHSLTSSPVEQGTDLKD